MGSPQISPLGVGPYKVIATGYVPGTLSSYGGLTIVNVSNDVPPLSQLVATGGSGFAKARVELGGTLTPIDTLTVTINGHGVTYAVVSGDTTLAILATHIAAAINADSTDLAIVKAKAIGNDIQIEALLPGAVGQYSLAVTKSGGATETITASADELIVTQNAASDSFPEDLALVQFMLRKAFVLGSGGGSGIKWDKSVDAVVNDYLAAL
jgi:hypothetical protein